MGDKGVFLGQLFVNYEELEIVGFDGIVKEDVHCDESAALVYHNPSNTYFLFTGPNTQSVSRTFPSNEIDRLVSDQRLTMLNSPKTLMKDAIVLYASRELIEASGYDPRFQFDGDFTIDWQRLTNAGTDTMVSCLPRVLAHRVMNSWAKELLKSLTEKVIAALAQGDIADINDIANLAEMALDAVRGNGMGESVLLRYGAALLLNGQFETLLTLYPRIKRRYPHWPKEAFVSQIKDTLELLRMRASSDVQGSSVATEKGERSLSVLSELAVSFAMSVKGGSKEAAKLFAAVSAAQQFRELANIPVEDNDLSFEDFVGLHNGHLHAYLTDQDVNLLFARPILYYPGVLVRGEGNRTRMNVTEMWKAYDRFGSQIWALGTSLELSSVYN